jgi:hypothetical protein
MVNPYSFPQIGIISLEEFLSQTNLLNEERRKLEIQLASHNEKVYTFEEAMNFLSMSDSTLRRKVNSRKIHYVQSAPGCRITFRKSHLLEYLDRNTKGPYAKTGNPLLKK